MIEFQPLGLIDFSAHPDYFFDKKVGRFRYKDSKKFAPREAVLSLTASYIDKQKKEFADIGSQLAEDEISLTDFQKSAAKILKNIHINMAILGANGLDNMTDTDWLRVGRTLKTQYYAGKDPVTGKQFGLKWLANDIKQGAVSPAQLRSRLGLYAKSGMLSYYQSQAVLQKNQGMTEVKRLLGVTDYHCPECVGYHQQGWVMIADLVLPGMLCSCKHNCLCSLEFR